MNIDDSKSIHDELITLITYHPVCGFLIANWTHSTICLTLQVELTRKKNEYNEREKKMIILILISRKYGISIWNFEFAATNYLTRM